MINNQQNEWTKRQTFNKDTLAVATPEGGVLLVNARSGRPPNEEVLLPVGGTIIAFLQAGSSIAQTLSNTETIINYELLGDGGFGVTKTGANFMAQFKGRYQIYVWFHLQQLTNSNVTKFWIIKNGVAVPFFGTTVEMKNSGDELSVSAQGFAPLNEGDVISVRAITTNSNGASLVAIPAAAPAPEIGSTTIQLIGYLQ